MVGPVKDYGCVVCIIQSWRYWLYSKVLNNILKFENCSRYMACLQGRSTFGQLSRKNGRVYRGISRIYSVIRRSVEMLRCRINEFSALHTYMDVPFPSMRHIHWNAATFFFSLNNERKFITGKKVNRNKEMKLPTKGDDNQRPGSSEDKNWDRPGGTKKI